MLHCNISLLLFIFLCIKKDNSRLLKQSLRVEILGRQIKNRNETKKTSFEIFLIPTEHVSRP